MTIATKAPRAADDCYTTPDPVIRSVLPLLPMLLGRTLDPAAGDGAFERVLGHRASTWTNIDIRDTDAPHFEQRDFLSVSCRGNYETIIANPPFARADDFIRHALEQRPYRVVMFGRLALLESRGRFANLWQYFPPRQVAVLVDRPSFIASGNTDRWAYAWFLWGAVPGQGLTWVDWKAAQQEG